MEKRARVVAIVRARMSSSRLPGKSLIDINGRPMIWHIFNRLKKTKKIDEIILATSSDKTDDPLAKYVRSLGFRVFRYRGDIDDVVGRILAAAKWARADIIAGICGDSPLIDPGFVDDVVLGMIKTKADSARLKAGQECQHEGLDICTLSSLSAQYRGATQLYHKEHLNIYLKERPDEFKWFEVDLRPPFNKHFIRLSVDTPSDLQFMRKVYRRLWNEREIVSLKKVIALCKKDKELRQINSGVKQKSKTDVSLKFVIRTDASEKVGFGHLRRMLSVAKELQDRYFCGVTFAVLANKHAEKILTENDFSCVVLKKEDSFCDFLRNDKSHGVIIDTPANVDIFEIGRLGKKSVVIDRIDKKMRGADLYIVPNAHSVVPDSIGNVVSGFKYVIIRDEIKKQKKRTGKYILICGGGADPKNITLKLLEFLEKTKFKQRFGVYIGPLNKNKTMLKKRVAELNLNAFIFEDKESFAEALAGCRFAILGFGQATYEALYLGVPIITVAHHEETISKEFLKIRSFRYLGVIDELNAERFYKEVNDFNRKARSFSNPLPLVDGNGAGRVAEKIVSIAK